MLRIRNYHKLCQKPVGVKGWCVDFCGERNVEYEIKLEHDHLSSIKVYLQREPARVKNGENVYLFKRGDGTLTSIGITPSWIKDINNLLKTLDNFTF
jgi:hypothetical protein